MKKGVSRRDSVTIITSNIVIPLCAILGVFMILHGQIVGNGGLQGGVLIITAAALTYVKYGNRIINKKFKDIPLSIFKTSRLIVFTFIACVVVIYSIAFAKSFLYGIGGFDKLSNLLNTLWLDFSIGFKAIAGIMLLILVIIKTLNSDEVE